MTRTTTSPHMPIASTSQLVAMNLKYGHMGRSLKTLAFAQLIAKILYLSAEPMKSSEIAAQIKQVLAISSVSTTHILEGLDLLAKETPKRVVADYDTWRLTDEGRDDLAKSVGTVSTQLDGVLSRHFSEQLDQTILRKWFNEVSAQVFGHYGDEWVSAVCKGGISKTSQSWMVNSLIEPCISSNGLEAHQSELVAGYIGFLKSDVVADQNYLMNLGQAMFSARLVAAGVGADPITLEEFKGSTMILDTNVLLAISLEGHSLARSFKALATALKKLEIKVVFIRPTLDEYDRAVEGKRFLLLRLVDQFPTKVIEQASDDFVSTALLRGCESVDSYETFFDTLRDVPNSMNGSLPISLLEDEEVQKAINKAAQDSELLLKMKGIRAEFTPRSKWITSSFGKSDLAAAHDAALLHVTEHLRSLGDKCWILSRDRGLGEYAKRRAGPHAMPAVISVPALIEIFAINDGGLDVDSSDFAPLLARMILTQCEPPVSTYTLADLNYLGSSSETAANLPLSDVQELVHFVAKKRIEGARSDDPSLQLEVTRRIQQKIMNRDEEIEGLRIRAKTAEESAEETRSRLRRHMVSTETDKLERRAGWQLAKSLMWQVPLTLLITYGLWKLVPIAVSESSQKELVQYLLSITGLVGSIYGFPLRSFNRYREAKLGAQQSAERLVAKEET